MQNIQLNLILTSKHWNIFLKTNGPDLSLILKEKIREKPDNYVLFENSEDRLEVCLKDSDLYI